MAENVTDGSIEVSKQEVKVPILVSTFNLLQVPIVEGQPFFRVFISNHGNIRGTWVSLTQDAMTYIKPPFYIYATTPCIIPALVT